MTTIRHTRNFIIPKLRLNYGRTIWAGGEIDTALALLRSGMVWDGNLPSKSTRDRFVENGWAVRAEGYQALTGRGVVALAHPRYWPLWFRCWRTAKRNPFVSKSVRPQIQPQGRAA